MLGAIKSAVRTLTVRPASSSPRSHVQSIVDVCSRIEPGTTQLDETLEANLLRHLEQVPLSDLGFATELVHQPDSRERFMGASDVSYMHIASADGVFSMGIFLFKAGARLGLHDHPDMSVYTRILFGEMDVVSYDWAGERPHGTGKPAQAVQHMSGVLRPGMVDVLYPQTGGNVHAFEAQTPAALLDVLIPGYVGARDATYFTKVGEPVVDADRVVQQLKVDNSVPISVLAARYRGTVPSLRSRPV